MFSVLTFTPAIRRSDGWSATVTPLASIMGSGFLVCAPLLASVVGNLSPLVMAGLLLLAWLIGGAIRFNILHAEQDSNTRPRQHDEGVSEHRLHRTHTHAATLAREWIEKSSHYVLAIAYLISVTYYIQLLAQFCLDKVGYGEGLSPTIFATVVLGTIAAIGFFFGLKIIEKVERYAINLNLAMIAALIAGLAVHNVGLLQSGQWQLPNLTGGSDHWHAFRVCLGLLIVVQGFETSRFLGAEHSAAQRVATMNYAQLISTAVYLVFLSLMLVVMTPDQASADAGVTAIVTLAGSIALILPLMITVAAVGSQFSAAVADEAGCGGLLQSLGGKWLKGRYAYLVIGATTIAFCWMVNVMQVIAIASRAFAAFYAIQCVVAATIAWTGAPQIRNRPRAVLYAVLAAICLMITVLGQSSE